MEDSREIGQPLSNIKKDQIIYFTKQFDYIRGELEFQIGYGLTSAYHNLLIQEAEKEKMVLAELIRKILNKNLYDETWLQKLKIIQKPDGILVKRRSINLTKNLYEKIMFYSQKYKIFRSDVIRRAIEDYLTNQDIDK